MPKMVAAATGPGTVPAAGTVGQILAKGSGDDYDVAWETPPFPSNAGRTLSSMDGTQLIGTTVAGAVSRSNNSTGSTGFPTEFGETFTFDSGNSTFGRVYSINHPATIGKLYIQYYDDATGAGLGWHALLEADGVILEDGANIAVATTTGTKIGTSVSQKLAFHGATAVPQRASAAQAAAPAGGTGTASGGYDTAAHRDALISLVNEMRTVLVEKGLMKGSV